MVDFGYDVSDYRQIDPLFGTLQDFDDMINKAHSLGTCKCYIQNYYIPRKLFHSNCIGENIQ